MRKLAREGKMIGGVGTYVLTPCAASEAAIPRAGLRDDEASVSAVGQHAQWEEGWTALPDDVVIAVGGGPGLGRAVVVVGRAQRVDLAHKYHELIRIKIELKLNQN